MILETLPQIQQMTAAQMYTLWEELGMEIALNPELNPTLAAEVRSELADYRANPDNVTPWEEVKRRIRAGEPAHG